jgi:ABC-type Fe3+/spermidine/putrescine transport system ATPase subunit
MIQVSGLSKTFSDLKRGTRLAVDDVSFEVRAGEVFGLLGPNGAGKTTTLRMLATLLKPSSGTATLNGFEITREPQKVREQIGFLSGDMGLYGRLTPLEMTPALCLVPIFNASQTIRGILQGDVSTTNFAITLAANLVYARIAFVIATRQFENESVLFRS